MNRLQKIPQDRFGIVLCSLNPPVQPNPDLVIGEYNYRHPHMTAAVSISLLTILSFEVLIFKCRATLLALPYQQSRIGEASRSQAHGPGMDFTKMPSRPP